MQSHQVVDFTEIDHGNNVDIYSGASDLRKGLNRLEMQGTRRVRRGTRRVWSNIPDYVNGTRRVHKGTR